MSDPDLHSLIATTRNIVMTPEQTFEQKRSFEIGQLMLDHPEFTRERATEIVDSVLDKHKR